MVTPVERLQSSHASCRMSRGETAATKKASESRPFFTKTKMLFAGGGAFGLALGEDGGVQPGAKVVGKCIDLVVLIDLDGLLGGVTDDVAVMAPDEMFFELRLELHIHRSVEEIVQLLQKFFAGHGCVLPDIMRIYPRRAARE